MQTILLLLDATLGLIAAAMIWLIMAQWRAGQRATALWMIAQLLGLIFLARAMGAGTSYHARGLS